MSSSPLSRLGKSLAKLGVKFRPGTRQSARRNLAFESLERRELLAVTALANMSVKNDTGEKPQSKVWEYNDAWYSVMPDSSGTWVWKLNGTDWQKQLQLSGNNSYHADVKVDGNLAHILLFDGSASQLATVEYDSGPDNRYEMWSLRPSLVNVAVNSSAETAVIDIDTTGRMWVAYDTSSSIEVRYADAASQYSSWSGPITVATGIKSDDIGTLIAMTNGQVGVFWSNQNSERFGFRYHVDGANPNAWSNDELPASQSAQDKGAGLADDHMHLAVASDGTIYAAVKTSYDSSGYPKIALLVRRPSGSWDNLYQVDTSGTRPIVMINETAGKLIIAYTSSENGGNIYYKESPLGNISLGARQTLISGTVNNVSSVKAPFTDEVVAIAASGSSAKGAMFRFDGVVTPPPPTNQAPNVSAGPDDTIQLPAGAALNGTVTDDGNPIGGSLTTSWSFVSGPGTVTFANASAVDTTATFSIAGTYVLRLTASDSALQASDTVTIVVQAPVTLPTNQPPNVSAGPDRTINLGGSASLDGTVTDDGLPSSPGAASSTWTKVSGPGTVTFGNVSAVDTTATFSVAGTYVLRLTASDGSLSAFDEMTVTVASASDPITVSFQDGVSGYNGTRDTKLNTSSKNTNYGSATTIDLDGRPDISDLFYWDLSQIPAGSQVDSVTLQFNVTNTSGQAYELYEMLRAWDETTATWNQAASGSSWGTAGASNASDRSTTVLGAFTPSATGLRTVTLNAAGIAAVQRWISDPSSNRGFVLQDYANSSGADLSTSEVATVSQRPKITITYRPAGPVGTPTNVAPTVSGGIDQAIQLPNIASLNGSVTDDGLPSSTLTSSWTTLSGPGAVTFGNAASATTTASFSQAGTYVLRLTGSDESLSAYDDITIVVSNAPAVNQGPNVGAGPNRSINLGGAASLDGTVTDDGLPSGSVTSAWTKVSGPGTVTFANASAVDTTATFSQAGTYILRLTASDGQLTSSDTMTVVAGVSNDPVSISFQDGVSGYDGTRDTKLNGSSVNTNYATNSTLDLDGSPDIAPLFYWDITAIPVGSVIESVSIQLNVTNTSSHPYPLYAMERAWDELSATWNQAANGIPWAAAGAQGTGDHGIEAIASILASNKGLNTVALNAAGIAAVQAWVDNPAANYGVIVQDYSNSNGADVSSDNTSSVTQRPKLIISYRPASSGETVPLTPANLPPSVDAGPSQRVQLPNFATLAPTVSETAGPSATPLLLWTRVSGPGTVTFGDASSADTTASFSNPGTYVLRLTVNDGEFATFDDLAIVVDSAIV